MRGNTCTMNEKTRIELIQVTNYLNEVLSVHEVTEGGTLTPEDEAKVNGQIIVVTGLLVQAFNRRVSQSIHQAMDNFLRKYGPILAMPEDQRPCGSYDGSDCFQKAIA